MNLKVFAVRANSSLHRITDKLSVLDLHTTILNDVRPRCLRFPCSLVVPNSLLHPDCYDVVPIERLLDDPRNLIGGPKDLDDIDRFPNVGERIERAFAEDLVRSRIDRQ